MKRKLFWIIVVLFFIGYFSQDKETKTDNQDSCEHGGREMVVNAEFPFEMREYTLKFCPARDKKKGIDYDKFSDLFYCINSYPVLYCIPEQIAENGLTEEQMQSVWATCKRDYFGDKRAVFCVTIKREEQKQPAKKSRKK